MRKSLFAIFRPKCLLFLCANLISRTEEDEEYDSDYQDGPVPVPVAFASVTADSAFGGSPAAAPPPPQGRKTPR